MICAQEEGAHDLLRIFGNQTRQELSKLLSLLPISCLSSALLVPSAAVVSAQNLPSAQVGTLSWTCQAFYLPARSIWNRTVAIVYDPRGIRTVAIDGVPVYSFSLDGSSVLTAIDGERIQFDVTKQTWSSDLRGVVSSQGRCER